MALSGRYEWKYDYGYGMVVFSWTATQNAAANTSTVKWELFGEVNPDCLYDSPTDSSGRPNYFEENFYVKADSKLSVNGTVVYTEKGLGSLGYNLWYFEDQHYSDGSSTSKVKASGTTTITHNADGSGTFTANFNGNISNTGPTYGWQPFNTTATFTLDKFNRTSSITATSGYIGDAITIAINGVNTSFTHTLTYTFGSLSGTIATKTSDKTVRWTLPSNFYNQLGNNLSKTGTITCETFSGTTSLGKSTATFTARANPDTSCPVLTPTVKDVNSDTVALTGNANKLIRYESMVEFSVGATARNGATIKTQSVKNGGVIKTDFATGIIDDVESGEFVFSATDSRGLTATQTITKEIVNYIKPTCSQNIYAELTGDTGASIYVEVSGSYFNGSFGAVNNTLKFEFRGSNSDGTMTDWTELPVSPTFQDGSYFIDITLTGYGYSNSYEFQSRISDKLNVVESTVYVVRVLPVFDWSKDDFNFNVPVNISADTLDIHNETVLRHGKTTNNTVLSGSGGHIYLRPGGTNDTNGEVRITAQGNIEITGDIIINGVSLVTALENKGII